MSHLQIHFTLRVLLVVLLLSAVVGCSGDFPFSIGGSGTPLPANTLAFDNAPVSLVIKNGAILPGTTIAYGGKTETGQAKVLLAGQLAPKQMADSVDWQGTPVPNVNVKLSTRVATFDDQSITLLGTANVLVANVTVQAGGAPGTALTEFNVPLTYSLKPKEIIPGTTVSYVGSTPDGAQFAGIEGYPYRKTLDSLQYNGRLNAKVYLRLDARIVSYTDSGVVLGGSAKLFIEQ
jgi:hypothetical protein